MLLVVCGLCGCVGGCGVISQGWEFVTCRRGITVHRKFMPSINGVMSKFCCVRASGVLEASCDDVAKLFEGNTRVSEYNKVSHSSSSMVVVPPRPRCIPLLC